MPDSTITSLFHTFFTVFLKLSSNGWLFQHQGHGFDSQEHINWSHLLYVRCFAKWINVNVRIKVRNKPGLRGEMPPKVTKMPQMGYLKYKSRSKIPHWNLSSWAVLKVNHFQWDEYSFFIKEVISVCFRLSLPPDVLTNPDLCFSAHIRTVTQSVNTRVLFPRHWWVNEVFLSVCQWAAQVGEETHSWR